jgi:hypothetical protein
MHSFSEQLMSAAFAMNSLRQEAPNPAISFVTLRTSQGENFCGMDRESFLGLHHRAEQTGLDKTDILTAMPFRSTPFAGLDLQVAPKDRCMPEILEVNVSMVCLELCRCGDSVRKVDIRMSSIEL